ncbi:MAG: hypothetical protein H3C59_15995 [Burkholderiaceae bacterium]|nr:hypothetical protein [Burkholderiaceae bacterium]
MTTALPAEDRVQLLVQSGLLAWNRRKLAPRAPVARVRGKKTIAELLVEDRE